MPQFALANERLLEVTLQNEQIMARAGAMVAYEGNIKFEKAILGGEGFLSSMVRRVAGEGMALMQTSGQGVVYFAENAIELFVLPLQGEKIWVESSVIMAYDKSLRTATAFAGLRGMTSGQGLATTTVEGHGNLCIMADGGVIALQVTQQTPLCVDPDAFLGYKGNIRQDFVFDANWKTFVGQASGETFQLKFSGDGVVFIQAAERK